MPLATPAASILRKASLPPRLPRLKPPAAALRANTVGVFHFVAEGIADALAINAREDGAALAVGGTSGFGRLARLIAEAADVSDLLGYSPGGD